MRYEIMSTRTALSSITSDTISRYRDYLLWQKRLSPATIERKLASLKRFSTFLEEKRIIPASPFEPAKPEYPDPINTNREPSLFDQFRQTSSTTEALPTLSIPQRFTERLNRIPFLSTQLEHLQSSQNVLMKRYITITVASLLALSFIIGGINQLFTKPDKPQAVTASQAPSRTIPFQGRLTDASGNPITGPRRVVFRLWNQAEGGTAVYNTGSCRVSPSTNGIIATTIGNGCGASIPTDIFTTNERLYLGVTVDNDEEMSPRQAIPTVGYAFNSATVGGYTPSASASANQIPVISDTGDLVITIPNPRIYSTSGTFQLNGQSLSLITDRGSDGDITISPDGTGKVNLLLNGQSGAQISARSGNLGTDGTLYYGGVSNQNPSCTLMQLASGAPAVLSGLGGFSSLSYSDDTDTTTIDYINQRMIEDALASPSGDILGATTLETIPSVPLSDKFLVDCRGNAQISSKLQVAGNLDSVVAYSRYGNAESNHSLSDPRDLLLSGRFEVDSEAFFDSNTTTQGTAIFNRMVGIGVTSPTAALDVLTTNTQSNVLSILNLTRSDEDGPGSGGLGSAITFNLEDDGSNINQAARLDTVWENASNGNESASFRFNLMSNGSLSEVARFTQDGNVGIGTTTPDTRTQISGGGLCVGSNTDCNSDNNTEGVVYAATTAMTVYDVAENYPTMDSTLQASELVVLDKTNGVFVKRSTGANDDVALGVISAQPGVHLGGFNGNQFKGYPQVAVGLSGRIPVKVTTEHGPIMIGDPLTLSSKPGVATKAVSPGRIIGHALENFNVNNPNIIGSIQFFIEPGYYSGTSLTASGNLPTNPNTITYDGILDSSSSSQQINASGSIISSLEAIFVKTADIAGETASIARANISSLYTKVLSTDLLTVSHKLTTPLASIGTLTVNDSLTSPLIQAENIEATGRARLAQIETGMIRPMPEEDVVINLQNPNPSTQQDPSLRITDGEKEVASIDNEGNVYAEGDIKARSASFSGQLIAENGQFNNATISGTLYAEDIITKDGSIKDLLAQRSPTQQVTNIYNTYESQPTLSVEPTTTIEPTPSIPSSPSGSSEWSTDTTLDPNLIAHIDPSTPLSGEPNTTATDIVAANGLTVFGKASLGETFITGPLLASGISISDSTITSFIGVLKIQDTASYPIEIMGGRIAIDTRGNMTVKGDLLAQGGLTTTMISPIGTGHLSINLKPASKFTINNEISEVASIDASGSAQFNTVAMEQLHATRDATIGGTLAASRIAIGGPGDAEEVPLEESANRSGIVGPAIRIDKTAGKAILPAGNKEMVIYTSYVGDNSLVYLTPQSSTNNKVVYVAGKKAGEFIHVAIDEPIEKDVEFNWWIIN